MTDKHLRNVETLVTHGRGTVLGVNESLNSQFEDHRLLNYLFSVNILVTVIGTLVLMLNLRSPSAVPLMNVGLILLLMGQLSVHYQWMKRRIQKARQPIPEYQPIPDHKPAVQEDFACRIVKDEPIVEDLEESDLILGDDGELMRRQA